MINPKRFYALAMYGLHTGNVGEMAAAADMAQDLGDPREGVVREMLRAQLGYEAAVKQGVEPGWDFILSVLSAVGPAWGSSYSSRREFAVTADGGPVVVWPIQPDRTFTSRFVCRYMGNAADPVVPQAVCRVDRDHSPLAWVDVMFANSNSERCLLYTRTPLGWSIGLNNPNMLLPAVGEGTGPMLDDFWKELRVECYRAGLLLPPSRRVPK